MIPKILAIIIALVFTGCSPAPEVRADVQIRVAYYDAIEDNFPIRAAANDWEENPVGVRLVRVPECKPGIVPCAEITQHNVRREGQMGGDYWINWELNDPYKRAFINLYYWPGSTYAERRMIICHEFGHYLQVPHWRDDCMRKWIRIDYGKPDPKPHPSQVSLDAVRFPADLLGG